VRCPSKSQKKEPSQEGENQEQMDDERTDGRTDMCESGFSSMQFPTRIVIGLGARAAEESKSAEVKGTTAPSSEYVRFQRELLFFEDLPLSVFFSRTLYTRE